MLAADAARRACPEPGMLAPGLVLLARSLGGVEPRARAAREYGDNGGLGGSELLLVAELFTVLPIRARRSDSGRRSPKEPGADSIGNSPNNYNEGDAHAGQRTRDVTIQNGHTFNFTVSHSVCLPNRP